MPTPSPLEDPRVQPESFVVHPSAWDQMGNSDRDVWCMTVTNGHAWGWSVRRGKGVSSGFALNRKGEWIHENRGSGHNKARRWPLEEALSIALAHVDTQKILGMTAADIASQFPRTPDHDDQ